MCGEKKAMQQSGFPKHGMPMSQTRTICRHLRKIKVHSGPVKRFVVSIANFFPRARAFHKMARKLVHQDVPGCQEFKLAKMPTASLFTHSSSNYDLISCSRKPLGWVVSTSFLLNENEISFNIKPNYADLFQNDAFTKLKNRVPFKYCAMTQTT